MSRNTSEEVDESEVDFRRMQSIRKIAISGEVWQLSEDSPVPHGVHGGAAAGPVPLRDVLRGHQEQHHLCKELARFFVSPCQLRS